MWIYTDLMQTGIWVLTDITLLQCQGLLTKKLAELWRRTGILWARRIPESVDFISLAFHWLSRNLLLLLLGSCLSRPYRAPGASLDVLLLVLGVDGSLAATTLSGVDKSRRRSRMRRVKGNCRENWMSWRSQSWRVRWGAPCNARGCIFCCCRAYWVRSLLRLCRLAVWLRPRTPRGDLASDDLEDVLNSALDRICGCRSRQLTDKMSCQYGRLAATSNLQKLKNVCLNSIWPPSSYFKIAKFKMSALLTNSKWPPSGYFKIAEFKLHALFKNSKWPLNSYFKIKNFDMADKLADVYVYSLVINLGGRVRLGLGYLNMADVYVYSLHWPAGRGNLIKPFNYINQFNWIN